jgi:hypothetical protein
MQEILLKAYIPQREYIHKAVRSALRRIDRWFENVHTKLSERGDYIIYYSDIDIPEKDANNYFRLIESLIELYSP